MNKRAKFFLVALILGGLSYLISWTSVDYRFFLIIGMSVVTYFMSVFALFDDLKGVEWFSLMVLPVLFVLGGNLFGNFLPNAVPSLLGMQFSIELSQVLGNLVRVGYYMILVFGTYGLLLVENIFSVAAIRTILLYRAARSVSFLFSMICFIFFLTTFFSLKLSFWIILIMVFAVSFLLSFPQYWSIDLKQSDHRETRSIALVTAWLMTIIVFPLLFWPLEPVMGALFGTVMYYAVLGGLEQRLLNKYHFENWWEYVVSISIVGLISFLTAHWKGN